MARAHLFRPIIELTGHGVIGNDMPIGLLSGATVAIYQPHTTTLIPQNLFVADSGTTTLTNPFVCTNGVVNIYLDTPQRVRIGVTPPGDVNETLIEDIDVGDQTATTSSDSGSARAIALALVLGGI